MYINVGMTLGYTGMDSEAGTMIEFGTLLTQEQVQ